MRLLYFRSATLSHPLGSAVTPVRQDISALDDEEDEEPYYIAMTPIIEDTDIKDARAGHLLVAWAQLATEA